MKRFMILVLVFVAVFAVSCSKKKSHEEKGYVEEVSKEISAEEGGTVESSDGKTSVEIPGGALDGDTTITMRIYDADGYAGTEDKNVVSKVVEFEPSGTIFKKPVIITMAAEEAVEGKIMTAAVYGESKGEWSYSEHGTYALLGRDAAGDPIMTTAAGDPIMLNASGEMTTAAGDPIMTSAAGDPIMLASAGDPIMTSAAGDPIMNAAAGDPIMMATGHFTAYTFIALEPAEPVETDDSDDSDDSDDETPDLDDDPAENDEPAETDDDEPGEPDEDTIPEPEILYSKVPCTGLRNCFGSDGILHKCPAESEELSGQDAGYIFRKSCVPKNFERIEKAEDDVTPYQQTKDNNTGLTWIFTGESGIYEDVAPYCGDTLAEYAGGGWRMPTPAELLTIADHDIYNNEYTAIKELYFQEIANGCEGCDSFWADGGKFYLDTEHGAVSINKKSTVRGLLCVKGSEYGKISADDYVTVPENGDEMIFDNKTNIYWQKTTVGGKTWKEALAYCENLTYAGHDDWRLPNKNELASLVDFTKENPASSFPAGMPAEEFVSSTFTLVGGAVTVDMKTGETGVLSFQEQPQVKSVKRGVDSNETYSVICVRSEITAYPENGIPECGNDGYAPCKASGIVWSPRQYFASYQEAVPWQDVARACRNMPGGKWRIPNIDEIRTLFSDDTYKPGGSCGVTTECSGSECDDGGDCPYFDRAFETPLRDSGILLSGTVSNTGSNRSEWSVWAIETNAGNGISEFDYPYGPSLVARCVLDESIDDPVTSTFPYTDTENGLVWSSLSKNLEGWKDAAEYCGTLVEGGSNNWRVPTETELRELVRNSSESGSNALDMGGKYSIFADIPHLWSSTVDTVQEYGEEEGDGNGEPPFLGDVTYVTTLDFVDAASVKLDITYTYSDLQARCVRSTEDPLENPDNLDEENDFPRETFHESYSDGQSIMWSKKSDLIYSREDAEAYCNSLTEEEYGDGSFPGAPIWYLPSVYTYLGLLVEEDQECSSECTDLGLLEDGESVQCFCNYTFNSHSLFNDFGLFWTSNSGESEIPYLFDFTSGEVIGGNSYGYNPAYVRCYAYLGA